MSPPIIQIKDVSIALSGNEILKRVSLDVAEGNYVSVIGPNGAGKTTLIKCIAGIYTDWNGSISISGKSFSDYSSKDLAKQQSYVPQAEGRASPLTVEDFVTMGRYPHLSPFTTLKSEDYAAIDDAIKRTALQPFRNRKLNTLSGGERQMAFIAAALAQKSKILLLDEPSTFLDYRHQASVASILRSACRDDGKTIIAVHHDINTAVASSDRICAIKDGAVIYHGSPKEIVKADTLREIYETGFTITPSSQHPLPLVTSGDLL